MVTDHKTTNALFALQGVLIRARALANQIETKSDQEAIMTLLDHVEELPRMLASPIDLTVEFRQQLVEIAERYNCNFVIERFDQAAPATW